jgi:hypothetical protein
MVLTSNYSVISSRISQLISNFSGWITPDNKFIPHNGYTHFDTLEKSGVDISGGEPILLGYASLTQDHDDLVCSVHYSNFDRVKRVLEKVLINYKSNHNISRVEFELLNDRLALMKSVLIPFRHGFVGEGDE